VNRPGVRGSGGPGVRALDELPGWARFRARGHPRHDILETTMYLIREIMYCKPGKVRPLVDKFKVMNELGAKMGMPKMRVMTDFCAERYWTIVSEMEVADLDAFEKMMTSMQGDEDDMKKMEEAMKGYHDLVDHGKREIYRIEF
jgi:hypothetical protein